MGKSKIEELKDLAAKLPAINEMICGYFQNGSNLHEIKSIEGELVVVYNLWENRNDSCGIVEMIIPSKNSIELFTTSGVEVLIVISGRIEMECSGCQNETIKNITLVRGGTYRIKPEHRFIIRSQKPTKLLMISFNNAGNVEGERKSGTD